MTKKQRMKRCNNKKIRNSRNILILLSLLFLSFLCSCGKDEHPRITGDGKKIITLAYVGGDSTVTKMVNEFNAQSADYFIEEKQYTGSAPNDRLIMDITRGEKIDMLFLSVFNDTSAYIGKGMFADLYEMIDNDTSVSRDTYAEGVLKAFENNGCLYEMPVSFGLYTSFGKSDIWKSSESISISELMKKSTLYNNAAPFANLGGAEGLKFYLPGSINEYIDFENGICDFNDGKFAGTLEFLDSMEQFSGSQAIDAFDKNEAMLYFDYVTELDRLDALETMFNCDLVFMGLPSDIVNFHTADADISYSILSASDNKKGAFEFIKFYTSEDYQISSDNISGFPINKAALSFLYDNEIQNKNEGIHHKMTPANLVNYEYDVLEDNLNEVLSQMGTLCGRGSGYGEAIGTIISEEANGFFFGSKTAHEAGELIQKRITIYLSEQYDK